MNYHIHFTITWIPKKSFITHSFVNQFFVFALEFSIIQTLPIICLVLLVFDIRFKYVDIYVFNNIRNTQLCIQIINVITTTTAFIYIDAMRVKWRFITITIYYLKSYFTLLIIYSNTFWWVCTWYITTRTSLLKQIFALQTKIFLYYSILFH